MEPEFVDCTNLWTVKEEPQEVEDVAETDTTGEEDCIDGTDEIQEEEENVAIKQEIEDEEEIYADDALACVETELAEPMEEDSSNAANPTENSIPPLVFPCRRCKKVYTSLNYLEMHRQICGGLKKQAARVESEKKSTKVLSNFRIIGGVKMYFCQFCEYKGNISGNVKRHLVTHTGVKTFKCEKCEKTFTHASNLNTHKRIHTGEKPHKCTQCGKAFTHLGSLKKHVKTHIENKEFPCKLCGYKAAESKTLIEHMRVHSEERPYSCTQCEYGTKQRTHLKRHVQMKHTDERPFYCGDCEYRTAVKCNLNKHMERKHIEKFS